MIHQYKKLYQSRIKSNLKEKFKYTNEHKIPKLLKIQLNRGLGLNAQNKMIIQKSVQEIRLVTGQHPIITKAKKSIAGFKTRKGMDLGITVTLRNDLMYAFLEKLIHLVFPRIRDFRGLNATNFDNNGNYHLGIREQLVFPDIDYNMIDQVRGYNISIVTSAKTPEEGFALLKEFGFPFKESSNY